MSRWVGVWIVVVTLVVVVGTAGGLFLFHPTMRFTRAWRSTEQIIEGVREPVPAGISERSWDLLWSAVRCSYGNGIFTVGYATPEQVRELGDDIAALDAGPLPPIEKARAMWDRIGSTAPKAAAYNERFAYLIDEAVAFAEAERDKAAEQAFLQQQSVTESPVELTE